jgi:hypothetical protein
MNAAIRPDILDFLARFFSPPNQLRHDSKPEIPTWLARLSRPDPLPTVLPCWRTGKVVDWYGLAFDDRQLTALGESLTAFVGPTYTTFRGQAARLDPADPIDQAVAAVTAGRAYKFRGADPSEIWRALERMRKVWQRRGSRERPTPSPVGRVLRDFYMALAAADAGAAEELLTQLREHYHLDAVNLLYLRLQMLAAFSRWADLLALSDLPDLLRLRRPAAVTEALVRAVYHTHLIAFEDPPDPPGAVLAFRAHVLASFGSLFASRAGMHSPEAAKACMLLAVAKDPPDLPLRDALLARDDLDPVDREYLRSLGALAQTTTAEVPAADPFALAGDAARENDFDRAFALAVSAPPSAARARLLCECACELGTLEARAEAVAAVNALDEAEKAAFLNRRVNQQLWENLSEDVPAQHAETAEPETVPTNWCAWLEHLDQHEGRNGSREIARRAADEWSPPDFLCQPGAVERFTARLAGTRSQAAEYALRDCLPHLIRFFHKDQGWPNPALKTVYRQFLELLFYSTEGGKADLVVFNELLEALLTLGATSADYGEAVSFTRELWQRFAAPLTLDWALDALELLAASPSADPAARRSFLQLVLDRAAAFGRFLTPDQRDLLLLTATDLGERDLASSYFPASAEPAEQADDPIAALKGKSVAVYTLTQRSAEQFQRIVQARAPGVTLALLHDLDASKRLQQHARQADLFVMVTASAKHAATNCIRRTRSAEKPLLIPTGKGAASMLAALRSYLERSS